MAGVLPLITGICMARGLTRSVEHFHGVWCDCRWCGEGGVVSLVGLTSKSELWRIRMFLFFSHYKI